MKKKNHETREDAFTLIELLVVFVIIIILATMVFRLMGMGADSQNKAETRSRMEKYAHAIEAFRSHNGKYIPFPPAMKACECKCTGAECARYGKPCICGSAQYYSAPRMPDSQSSASESVMAMLAQKAEAEGTSLIRMSPLNYLFPRGYLLTHIPRKISIDSSLSGTPEPFDSLSDYYDSEASDFAARQGYVGDNDNDMATVFETVPLLGGRLMQRYIDGKGFWYEMDEGPGGYGVVHHDGMRPVCEQHGSDMTKCSPECPSRYYEERLAFYDAWWREVMYVSLPPYDSYELISAGKDGCYCTAEDNITIGSVGN